MRQAIKVIRCGIVGVSIGDNACPDDAWQSWKHRMNEMMEAVSKKDWQSVSQLYNLYTQWEPDVHIIESDRS